MSQQTIAPVKFEIGQLVITRGADETLNWGDMISALTRHMAGDWGELDEEDWRTNDEALETGHRLLSAYFDRDRTKFWIITGADRQLTTILLPEEY